MFSRKQTHQSLEPMPSKIRSISRPLLDMSSQPRYEEDEPLSYVATYGAIVDLAATSDSEFGVFPSSSSVASSVGSDSASPSGTLMRGSSRGSGALNNSKAVNATLAFHAFHNNSERVGRSKGIFEQCMSPHPYHNSLSDDDDDCDYNIDIRKSSQMVRSDSWSSDISASVDSVLSFSSSANQRLDNASGRVRWLCDHCLVSSFDTEHEAMIHELSCRHNVNAPLLSPPIKDQNTVIIPTAANMEQHSEAESILSVDTKSSVSRDKRFTRSLFYKKMIPVLCTRDENVSRAPRHDKKRIFSVKSDKQRVRKEKQTSSFKAIDLNKKTRGHRYASHRCVSRHQSKETSEAGGGWNCTGVCRGSAIQRAVSLLVRSSHRSKKTSSKPMHSDKSRRHSTKPSTPRKNSELTLSDTVESGQIQTAGTTADDATLSTMDCDEETLQSNSFESLNSRDEPAYHHEWLLSGGLSSCSTTRIFPHPKGESTLDARSISSPSTIKKRSAARRHSPTPAALSGRMTSEELIVKLRLGDTAKKALVTLMKREGSSNSLRSLSMFSAKSHESDEEICKVVVPKYKRYVSEAVTTFRREVLGITDDTFSNLRLSAYNCIPLVGRDGVDNKKNKMTMELNSR